MTSHIHREPLTSDLIFKAVYGQDTPQSKKALILLLNLILKRVEEPVVDLVYKNPFSLAECSENKQIIMDILAETQNGAQIDIEMQVHVTGVFINRTIYYGGGVIRQGLESGEDYVKLKKSIIISIVCGCLFPDIKAAHTCFIMREKWTGEELTNMFQLHYLELGKIHWEGRPPEELSPLEQFGAYLCCSGQPEQEAYLEQLLRTGSEVISVTDKVLKKVSEDERMWAYRHSRDIFLHDQASLRNQAREEGLAEGREEGRRKEAVVIAKRLKTRKMGVDEIVEVTGLSPEEIQRL